MLLRLVATSAILLTAFIAGQACSGGSPPPPAPPLQQPPGDDPLLAYDGTAHGAIEIRFAVINKWRFTPDPTGGYGVFNMFVKVTYADGSSNQEQTSGLNKEVKLPIDSTGDGTGSKITKVDIIYSLL